MNAELFTDLSFSHLFKEVKSVAMLPAEERIRKIRAERWIGYPRAQAILAKLNVVYNYPPKTRMPNLLIVGPTNNGKSMIIEKFRRLMTKDIQSEPGKEHIPVVAMQMPSDPTIARFYSLLLYKLGAPTSSRCTVSDLEAVAIDILRKVRAKILVIDELHNVLAGRHKVQTEFLNLLRFLGNELMIPIICVGTRDAYLAIRNDSQLENRFEPCILPVWQDDSEFASLLASFRAIFPLRRDSEILQPEIRSYILNKTEGTIGEISMLLTRAAILAIESGEECIGMSLLARTEYDSPTERRRQCERELQ